MNTENIMRWNTGAHYTEHGQRIAAIEVDGGVNLETGALLAAAGADALVAGSFVFGSADPAATISALKSL